MVVNTKMFNTTKIRKTVISDPSFEEEIQNFTGTGGTLKELDDSFLSANNSIPSDDRGTIRTGQVYIQPPSNIEQKQEFAKLSGSNFSRAQSQPFYTSNGEEGLGRKMADGQSDDLSHRDNQSISTKTRNQVKVKKQPSGNKNMASSTITEGHLGNIVDEFYEKEDIVRDGPNSAS